MQIVILSIALGVVSIVAIVFLAMLISFRRASSQLASKVEFILSHDTNQNVDLVAGGAGLKRLAKALSHDIDRLKRIRHDYRRKDIELRESIANISHDLRTPLTVIASYTSLIERRGAPNTDPKLAQMLGIIKDRIAAMNALIEELFAYSLYENPQVEMELEDVCLNDSLENMLTEMYQSFTDRQIKPQITITQKRIVRRLNHNALDRILSNILTNALRYSDGDLEVVLKKDGTMEFSNMASQLDIVSVGKLFNRFFTVENARSSTGLGLSIAKLLTERMGGEITAKLTGQKLTISLKL